VKRLLHSALVCIFFLSLPLSAQDPALFIGAEQRQKVKEELMKQHGEAHRFRIERGVDQVADLWRKEDGDADVFAGYCRESFIADPAALDAAFQKSEFYGEILNGFFGEMGILMNQPVDLDWGEITPIDMAMAEFNPAAHLSEDLYQNKIAFFSLLNFPAYDLKEKTELGPGWSRKEWAYARTGGTNNLRVPPDVIQRISSTMAVANRYVSEYNIFMGSLVDDTMTTSFPADMKLITHWGLRDELKARYKDPQGLAKQWMIYRVMERIIRQEIPNGVINSPTHQWNPTTNKVYQDGKEIAMGREEDERYRQFLNVFQTRRMIDAYSPKYPTQIIRNFETGQEILEKDVEALFVELLSSPQVRKVAALIQKRLNRKLLPFDIWYPGFAGEGGLPEEELDKIVAQKYPTIEAFEKDIANILVELGFSPETAASIAPLIQVDPARGSGHATGYTAQQFKVRLRTRVPKNGMNYKGYNIAMHELGHAVEAVLDGHKIDYHALSGVPNNAFTEAFAFVFQGRDLQVLGVEKGGAPSWEMKVLDNFWNAYEIMGVALVDMKVWHWLYEHPEATPAELRQAEIRFATEVWNMYYADVIGVKDQPILAIYAHQVNYPLYLPNYPLGHVIQFQLEEYLRGKAVGSEMERMCSAGNIIPQLWMKNAVGSEISVKPLLAAVDQALKTTE